MKLEVFCIQHLELPFDLDEEVIKSDPDLGWEGGGRGRGSGFLGGHAAFLFVLRHFGILFLLAAPRGSI